MPTLRTGEQLTRAEFERRYAAMPHIKRAELLEGVVVVGSPVHVLNHGKPHGQMMAWLGVYYLSTPGTMPCDNATTRLDANTVVQPDALLRIAPEAGGESLVSDDDYVEGAPELVVEIASSSVPYDAGLKRIMYQRCGVQEYLLWQTEQQRLDWWELRDGRYHPLLPDADGIITSRVFPGLYLHAEALLHDDMAAVLKAAQHGLASANHAAFVEQLSHARKEYD